MDAECTKVVHACLNCLWSDFQRAKMFRTYYQRRSAFEIIREMIAVERNEHSQQELYFRCVLKLIESYWKTQQNHEKKSQSHAQHVNANVRCRYAMSSCSSSLKHKFDMTRNECHQARFSSLSSDGSMIHQWKDSSLNRRKKHKFKLCYWKIQMKW